MGKNVRFSKVAKWFREYTRSYLGGTQLHDHAIQLKIIHSARVTHEIEGLRKYYHYRDIIADVASTAGLLHDIGRFEQYRRYATYMDARSVNHAELGIEQIESHNVLHEYSQSEQALIINAIRFHNRAALPDTIAGDLLVLARLLRDADKLDIWRVVTEYYLSNPSERSEVIELNLPDTGQISPEVVHAILSGDCASVKKLNSADDLKVLQMGWVFDINFPRSLQLAKDRGYMDVFYRALPESPLREEVYKAVSAHIMMNLPEKS